MIVENVERVVMACSDSKVLASATKVVYPTYNKETIVKILGIDIHQGGITRPEL